MPFRLRLIFALLMSSLMTFLMSGWVTWINIGFSENFLTQWRLAGTSAWPPAFIIVLLIAPGVQRVSHTLLRLSQRKSQSGNVTERRR